MEPCSSPVIQYCIAEAHYNTVFGQSNSNGPRTTMQYNVHLRQNVFWTVKQQRAEPITVIELPTVLVQDNVHLQ